VGETEILVEQPPLQGVFICDHAGRKVNAFFNRCAPVSGGDGIFDDLFGVLG
jgi:hypothetical protein